MKSHWKRAVSGLLAMVMAVGMDAGRRKAENLSHERRRHWDSREFDEYIAAAEGILPCQYTPEDLACQQETLDEIQDASYPFLIQEKYRAGYFTHYAGEGTIRSAKVCHNGEEVDLCLCRTKAHFSQEGNDRVLTLDPVEIVFSDLTVKLQSVITFPEGTGDIKIQRNILEMSDPEADVTINEYMVGCYGTTEYTEDMSSLTLGVAAGNETQNLPYEYKCRELSLPGADTVWCKLPPIKTLVGLECEGRNKTGYVKEGYAFSPMFTLGYTGTLKEKEAFTTWLRLKRAD